MKIACLHTLEANAALFDEACPPGVTLEHHFREDLLSRAIERGEADLSPEADRTTRVTIGHAEGMPLAFANIYADLAEVIRADHDGRPVDPAADLYPRAEDGLRSVVAVHQAAASAGSNGAWVDAIPDLLK